MSESWWPPGYDLPAFRVKRQTYGQMAGGDWVRGAPHTALRYPSTTGVDFSDASSRALMLCRPADHSTVEILWGWPTVHQNWLEVALVRSSFGHPSTPRDGVTVYRKLREVFEVDANGNPLVDDFGRGLTDGELAPPPVVLDQMVPPGIPPKKDGSWTQGLVPNGRNFYYTLFFRTNDIDWVAAMSDSCLLPRNFHHSEYMWDCVPPYYQWVDDQYRPGEGHLRRFLSLFGFVMDNTREFVEGLLDLHYIDKTPMPLLKGLGANYGLPYESGIGEIRYRGLVANVPNAQHTRGTVVGLRRLIEAVSKYETEITGNQTLMLFPDDSDFFRSTGNWGGIHPDAVNAVLAQKPGLASTLPWNDVYVARVDKPPKDGRGVMRVYTAKVKETSNLLIAVGDSRIRQDPDDVLAFDADTVPPATTVYRDATPLMAGVTVTAGVPYGFSVWIQAPEKNFNIQLCLIWTGPSGDPQEVLAVDTDLMIGSGGTAWKQYFVKGKAPVKTDSLPEARYVIPAVFISGRQAHTLNNRSAAIDVSGAILYQLGDEDSPVSVTPPDRYLTLGVPGERLGEPTDTFEGYVMGSPQGGSAPSGEDVHPTSTSYFFTDNFQKELALNQNLMDSASFRLVLFRYAPSMNTINPSWVASRTVSELVGTSGWTEIAIEEYPLDPAISGGTVVIKPDGSVGSSGDVGSRYMLFSEYKFSQLEGVAEVRAIGVVLVGTFNGVVDPLIFVTNSPLRDTPNISPGDSLTSYPDKALPGGSNTWMFSWATQIVAGTATSPANLLTKTPAENDLYRVTSNNHWWRYIGPNPNDNLSKWVDMGVARISPIEGPLALSVGPPEFEVSGSQHCWLYPQRVNMIANPNFEAPGVTPGHPEIPDFWSSNEALIRVSGTAPGSSPTHGWAGHCEGYDCVMESNIFSTRLGEEYAEQWTIQLEAKGEGTLKVGFVYWDAGHTVTLVDWGEDESWELGSDWLHIATHRRAPEASTAMVRLEVQGSSLTIDNVLAERGFLKDWSYFDGDEKYGVRDDFSWYGGFNRRGASYSLWYNHRKAVTSRLFARTVDPNDPDKSVTDEDMEEQGLAYRWVPAGITVVPHLDIFYPFDAQNPVSAKPAGVLPYYSIDAPEGVPSPWV